MIPPSIVKKQKTKEKDHPEKQDGRLHY